MNDLNNSNGVKKVNKIVQTFIQKDQVNPDLSAQSLNSGLIFKFILISSILLTSIITGLVGGLLGNYMILNILVSSHAYNYVALTDLTGIANSSRAVFSGAAIVVLTWLFSTLYKGLLAGLKNAIIVSIVITTILGISKILNGLYIFNTILVILICLILAYISLFLGYFSLDSTFFLIEKYIVFKTFNFFLINSSACFFAYVLFELGVFDNSRSQYLKEQNILPESIKTSIILGSLLISLFISTVSLSRTLSSNSYWKDFNFLKSLALRISCWGGTSFYNLDLSNVNFRNAKLANTDLRARKLYRTCFQGVTGLERARVDSRYLDLENPKVQKLLTEGRSEDRDFSGLNLRGAYLQNAELRRFNFTDTDLTGADMQGADLRGCVLVRAQVIGVDFTNADLTGCCIEDWSINSQTCFTDVRCEYIYRKLDEHGEPIERFPSNRSFEPREFESLYQEVENVVELIFKEGENWRAALFSLRKLQLEDEELGLELKSIEKRGDLWVLKVTHNNAIPKQEVEHRLNATFDDMKQQLAAKEERIEKLLGIITDQAKVLSKQALGTSNNFFIVGSAITNLSSSGQIDYQEAANQVRNIVANSSNTGQSFSLAGSLLEQFQNQQVAVIPTQQTELIEQIILAEAEKDTVFKQLLLLQGERISETMPEGAITSAIRNAIAKLNQSLP